MCWCCLLQPPMPQCRLSIIDQAFNKMDKDDDGVITIADLKNVYSVKEHPKYQSGEKSEDEILTDFLHNFEGGRGNLDGKVCIVQMFIAFIQATVIHLQITREEFVNYYATISASIDNDMYFDLMMRRAYAM